MKCFGKNKLNCEKKQPKTAYGQRQTTIATPTTMMMGAI
jgi:hypothetical protein